MARLIAAGNHRSRRTRDSLRPAGPQPAVGGCRGDSPPGRPRQHLAAPRVHPRVHHPGVEHRRDRGPRGHRDHSALRRPRRIRPRLAHRDRRVHRGDLGTVGQRPGPAAPRAPPDRDRLRAAGRLPRRAVQRRTRRRVPSWPQPGRDRLDRSHSRGHGRPGRRQGPHRDSARQPGAAHRRTRYPHRRTSRRRRHGRPDPERRVRLVVGRPGRWVRPRLLRRPRGPGDLPPRAVRARCPRTRPGSPRGP
jgi:hypothetical protein